MVAKALFSNLATGFPHTHQLLDSWEMCSAQYQTRPYSPQASLMQTFLQFLSSVSPLSIAHVLLQGQMPEHPWGGLPFCVHSSIVPMPQLFHWVTEWLSASPVLIHGIRCLYPISSLQRASWQVGTLVNWH